MNYSIEYEVAGNYLLVVPVGERSLDANVDLALMIDEASRKNNCTMIVVDIRGLSGGSPGVVQDYQFAQFAGTLAAGKHRRVALIYPADKEKNVKFLETAARNNGVDLMAFLTIEEAREWFKKDET